MSLLLVRGSASHLPLASESVQCVVTSPPYWGLRQYAGEQREVWGGEPEHAHEWGTERLRTVQPQQDSLGGIGNKGTRGNDSWTAGAAMTTSQGCWCACGAWYGALGLEPTPELYVEHMVAIFREVRRVLRKDGTLWLNLGDSYSGSWAGHSMRPEGGEQREGEPGFQPLDGRVPARVPNVPGLKPKDLIGIPWRVAFALQADGWYLRSDIIWAKPNPMPESVTDRPTKAHEYLFLLSKSERYFYDADAIREAAEYGRREWVGGADEVLAVAGIDGHKGHSTTRGSDPSAGRNKRTVWTIATRPYPGAHFATYPEDLVEPCILAGSAAKACGVCGAPWERITERTPAAVMAPGSEYGDGAGRNDGHRSMLVGARSETTGWQPTCAHADDTGASLVLDPFNGSGTTGRVAIRHGRNYVGLDISDEYLRVQSRARIDNIQHVMGGLGV